MEFPKWVYRGAFASQADLEAAWRDASVESRMVADVAAEVAALEDGFVTDPLALVDDPNAPANEVQPDGTVIPRRRGRPRKVQ